MFLGRNRAKLLGPSGPGRQGCLFCWGPSAGLLGGSQVEPSDCNSREAGHHTFFCRQVQASPSASGFRVSTLHGYHCWAPHFLSWCLQLRPAGAAECLAPSVYQGRQARRQARRQSATESSLFPLSGSNQPLSHPPASRGKAQIHFHASSPSPPHGLHFIQ